MSRITVVLSFLFLSLFPAETFAGAPTCSDQVWGFNIYERLESGKIVEKYSVFEIDDWSEHSSFQGLLIKSKKSSELEVEMRREGSTVKTQSWAFKSWDYDKDYYEASGFDPSVFFSGAEENSYFVLRIKQGGKTICESAPLEVVGQD